MDIISSVQNNHIKRWYKLLSKKGREEQSAFLVEGFRLVEEAIRSGADIQAIIIDSEKSLPEKMVSNLPQGCPVYTAAPHVVAKISSAETPQGIVAVVGMQEVFQAEEIGKIFGQRSFFLAMLDGVQDPGNVGTIIRTADAAGVDAVILGEGTADLYNPKTVRSTMGSLFHLPVIKGNLQEWAGYCQAAGGKVIASAVNGETAYTESVFSNNEGKVALIIGSEADGVSPDLLQLADVRVNIPIYGQAESLNAAVAAAVLLYEGARQRSVKPRQEE